MMPHTKDGEIFRTENEWFDTDEGRGCLAAYNKKKEEYRAARKAAASAALAAYRSLSETEKFIAHCDAFLMRQCRTHDIHFDVSKRTLLDEDCLATEKWEDERRKKTRLGR